MAGYQVTLIDRPQQWQPQCPDDVPSQPDKRLTVLEESDDLFVAVRRAIEHNETAGKENDGRWAVVVESGIAGPTWSDARLCTPIAYKIATIWWPEGWEPGGPLDVPNCVFQTQGPGGEERMTYPHAETVVGGLNRQCIDEPGATWHVIVAVENEPVSQAVSYEPSGTETTVEVRQMHVIRPESGGRGDCSHCPAHAFECAQAQWHSQRQTVTTTRRRDRTE